MELGAGPVRHWPAGPPAGILIGYAPCSTEKQDLTVQREILRDLGVAEERVYLDHGLTGTNRSRSGLNIALAAPREGDTLVVPKLDRLARSVPDARAIGDDPTCGFPAEGGRASITVGWRDCVAGQAATARVVVAPSSIRYPSGSRR